MIKKMVLGNMQVNCYIIYNDKKHCVIVDPGAQGKKIYKYVVENELVVDGIILTHGHFDHIGAVDYLYEKLQCPIYTHQETLELLNDPNLNLSCFDSPFTINSPITIPDIKFQIGEFSFVWFLLEGHCQGSSMIYYPDEDIIFSGDVLFKGSIGRFDFPTSSHFATKQTLEIIKSFDFNAKILPGHGDETTLEREKKDNPYLKS